MAQRSQLALTTELEKLEQSITLTLQEIDHNFARAHRIVTTSILPIVDRYAKESEAVWEGSKFWKHFFETSANVSLSNYQEEETTYHDNGDQTELTETTATQHTYGEESTFPGSSPGHYTNQTGDFTRDRTQQPHDAHPQSDSDLDLDDSLLESLNLTGGATQSTPQRHSRPSTKWEDSPFDSPPTAGRNNTTTDTSMLPPPTTPRRRPDISNTLDSSSPLLPTGRTPAARTPGPVLHRVLDKNWRIAATPLGKPTPSRYTSHAPTTPRPAFTPVRRQTFDSSPISSPPEPHLQTQIFSPAQLASRTPQPKPKPIGRAAYAWNVDDSSSSDDELLMPEGYSPPKTMQFSLPPGRLLATPAREASRRIVKDILRTAGDEEVTGTTVESSPPRRADSDDDPF